MQHLHEPGSELLPRLAVGEQVSHILQFLPPEPGRMDTYDGSMPEENKPSPRFLTIDQVATELNIGQPLVRGLLKSGELRGFQLGGRNIWRIGTDDLQDYIDDAYRKTAERIAAGDLDETPTEEV
ncbi:excisionase family DNA binding protein [Arthrobacter pascens]|nr:excisionase family DNA binding protein [Arthrobacter pascens]